MVWRIYFKILGARTACPVLDFIKDEEMWEVIKRRPREGMCSYRRKACSVCGENIFMRACFMFPPEMPAALVLQTVEDFESRPSKDTVRAKMHFSSMLVEKEEDGCTQLIVSSLIDLRLPVVPIWMMNPYG